MATMGQDFRSKEIGYCQESEWNREWKGYDEVPEGQSKPVRYW